MREEDDKRVLSTGKRDGSFITQGAVTQDRKGGKIIMCQRIGMNPQTLVVHLS